MRIAIWLCLIALYHPIHAANVLILQVSDLHDRPLAGVVVSTKAGGSTSAPTDVAGKTRITLTEDIRPGQSIALILVKAPSGKLRFYSPWEGAATVPLSNLAIPIVLGSSGDSAALKNPTVLGTLADVIGTEAQLALGNVQLRRKALNSVSQESGLNADELDSAIRDLANGKGMTGSPHDYQEARRYVNVMDRSEGQA